jgi:hypothetical protein
MNLWMPLVGRPSDAHSPRTAGCGGYERPCARPAFKEMWVMDENKRNLQYFESGSMAELFDALQVWQHENEKRFLSLDIQNDHGKFCCIALTNPTEVVIMEKGGNYIATKHQFGAGYLLATTGGR